MIEDGYPIEKKETWKAQPGARAGALILVEIDTEKGGVGQKRYWKCKCEKCGRNDLVSKREDNLKIGAIGGVVYPSGRKYNGTRSCGCKQKKSFVAANTTGTILQNNLEGQILNGWKVLQKTCFKDLNSSYLYVVQSEKYPDYCTVLSGRHLRDGYCADANIDRKYNNIKTKLQMYVSAKPKMSKNEEKILNLCKENNIHGKWQYSTEKCKFKSCLPFDFFIEDKYIIEYDGEQHFKYNSFFYANEEEFNIRRTIDLVKNKYCFDNNIPIIRIPYDANYTVDDLKLETTRFLLTPENEKEYYESRE